MYSLMMRVRAVTYFAYRPISAQVYRDSHIKQSGLVISIRESIMAIQVFNELEPDSVSSKFLLQITEELARNIPLFQAIVSECQQPCTNELHSPTLELEVWKQVLKDHLGETYRIIEAKVESDIARLKTTTRSGSEDTSTSRDESNDQVPELAHMAENEQIRRNQDRVDDVIHVILLLRRYFGNLKANVDVSPWV